MKTNSCRVYFGLSGDFNPEDITKIIGISPTEIKIAGERIPNKIPVCSQWNYSSEEIEADFIDVNEISLKVIEDLIPFTKQLKKVILEKQLSACLEVVLWISSNEKISTPAISFDLKILKFLTEVGASIDIDTYKN